MLFRRLDLSSVSHAWNRDESKHNGRSWGRAWKTRLLLWAMAAAGYTDAPRNRANIGATEFSPYIHHFSALSIKGRLGKSYEEVVFAISCLNKQLRMFYLSPIFSLFFWCQYQIKMQKLQLLNLKSNKFSPVFTPPAETDVSLFKMWQKTRCYHKVV